MIKISNLMKYLKSLNWNKEDGKKIIMFVIMLFIACFIINNFLLVKFKIVQDRWDSLEVNAWLSGNVNSEVSGSVSTY
jgi:hypothetical protein